MNNVMSCKGYSARVEYDDEDGILFGRITGVRDGVGFHADSVEELRTAFRDAVDDYIETCARVCKEPQKPYSGKMMLRVDPEVHRKASLAAEISGKSHNQWAEETLARAADLPNSEKGAPAFFHPRRGRGADWIAGQARNEGKRFCFPATDTAFAAMQRDRCFECPSNIPHTALWRGIRIGSGVCAVHPTIAGRRPPI